MEIKDLTVLVVNPWVDSYVEGIRKREPELKVIASKLLHEFEEEIDADVGEVDIILSFTPLIKAQPKMKHLKWFQSLAAGINHIIDSGLLTRDVILTSAAGVAGIGMAEFVMTMMLAFMKKFPLLIDNQKKKVWDFWCSGELYGKTLGILGLGYLGKPLAKTAKLGFNMNVVAFDKFVEEYEYADGIYSDLKPVLEQSDVVVVTLPLVDDTTDLLNEDTLNWMKESAFLINVARGEIINREALIKALKDKRIAGAGLDVFWGDISQLHLSSDDELWNMDNVIISPHTAWFSEHYHERAVDLFFRNLERFIKGEKLLNEVKF
ncbi:MAG: D-2-hydroxyacid dehydrogenase [Thermodesulfobacteriota bacterium]|nr:D-2-hydroxyacid dehydrogenase [Thermodesulfobacteriota bacterium]